MYELKLDMTKTKPRPWTGHVDHVNSFIIKDANGSSVGIIWDGYGNHHDGLLILELVNNLKDPGFPVPEGHNFQIELTKEETDFVKLAPGGQFSRPNQIQKFQKGK